MYTYVFEFFFYFKFAVKDFTEKLAHKYGGQLAANSAFYILSELANSDF